jgi:hypothetical protein
MISTRITENHVNQFNTNFNQVIPGFPSSSNNRICFMISICINLFAIVSVVFCKAKKTVSSQGGQFAGMADNTFLKWGQYCRNDRQISNLTGGSINRNRGSVSPEWGVNLFRNIQILSFRLYLFVSICSIYFITEALTKYS